MNISEVYQLLVSAYNDWSHVLANPQFIRRDSRNNTCITWNNRVPSMLDHIVKYSVVAELFDEGQYTYQVVEDGSLIQIYYEFDTQGNNLKSARLAFYSADTNDQRIESSKVLADDNSATLLESEDIDLNYVLDDPDESILYETAPSSLKDDSVSWLRIEYAPGQEKGVLHHDCHMHFSAFPYSRFVVAGVPTPTQFIEFIMALCYPKIYKAHRLNENGQYADTGRITSVNSACFPTTDSIIFSQIAHFRIPSTSVNRGPRTSNRGR